MFSDYTTTLPPTTTTLAPSVPPTVPPTAPPTSAPQTNFPSLPPSSSFATNQQPAISKFLSQFILFILASAMKVKVGTKLPVTSDNGFRKGRWNFSKCKIFSKETIFYQQLWDIVWIFLQKKTYASSVTSKCVFPKTGISVKYGL